MLKPLKQAVKILLHRIKHSYPPPPTSGIKATLTVYSSREFADWFNTLSNEQRNAYVGEAFQQSKSIF
jgi:hypothetical protein